MTGNQQVQAHLGALWTLLSQMKIEGPGAERRFEEALAADKGWSLDFAERATREYRRFLYLAASSAGEITPSRAVDAAWHLHLTYSRHYWDELCGRILGRPLHHNPSSGAAADEERFARQYEDTLALYRRTFGQTPPADIWPPAAAAGLAEPDEEEPEGPDNAVQNLVFAFLSVPALFLLGGFSLGGAGAALGTVIGFSIVGVFLLHPPPPGGSAARRKRATAAGGCGGSGCGGTGSGWGGDSDGGGGGSSCGGGCGGD